MTEFKVKSVKPLPDALPPGERVLWQGVPAWKPYSQRVFKFGWIALYFLIVIAWVAISAYLDNGTLQAVLRSLTWAVPPALGVLALVGLIAWLYARSSVFTITNKRVVIQSGLALPSAVNLPFSNVTSADLKCFSDGTGDIQLEMSGPRLLYSMIWPNLRLLRLRRPAPMLRAVEEPQQVGKLLADAIASTQVSNERDAKPTEPTDGQEQVDSGSVQRTALS